MWSVGFFGLLSIMLAAGYHFSSDLLLTLGYVLPHLFAFVSIGYLWKVQSSINFPNYQKLFWLFAAYGVFVAAFGVYEMPDVLVENGSLLLGPESTFSMLIPLGMALSAIIIAGGSFYSAYITRGDTRIKLSLIGIGTIVALVISAFLKNMGYSMLGEITNLIWITTFVAVAYWSELKTKYQQIRE